MASLPPCPDSSTSSAHGRTSSRPRPSSPRSRRAGAEQQLIHTGQHYDRAHVGGLLRGAGSAASPTSTSAWAPARTATQTAALLVAWSRPSREQAPDRVDRLRRRQLHPGGGAGLRQAAHPGRTRGGRPALVRRDHARGGQPPRHRHPQRPALRDRARGRAEPRARGHQRRPRGLRGQPHDRHAAGQPRPLRPGAGAWRGWASRRRTRWPRCIGRPTSTRPEAAAALVGALREATARLPLVLPLHPRGRRHARAGRSRRGARPAGRRSAGLHRLHLAGARRGRGHHRLGRHPGGDDGAGRALPDAAAQHRATHHADRRHQPAGHARHALGDALDGALAGAQRRIGDGPPGWDGHAGERIAAHLLSLPRSGLGWPRHDRHGQADTRDPAALLQVEPLPATAGGGADRGGRRGVGGPRVAQAGAAAGGVAGSRAGPTSSISTGSTSSSVAARARPRRATCAGSTGSCGCSRRAACASSGRCTTSRATSPRERPQRRRRPTAASSSAPTPIILHCDYGPRRAHRAVPAQRGGAGAHARPAARLVRAPVRRRCSIRPAARARPGPDRRRARSSPSSAPSAATRTWASCSMPSCAWTSSAPEDRLLIAASRCPRSSDVSWRSWPLEDKRIVLRAGPVA